MWHWAVGFIQMTIVYKVGIVLSGRIDNMRPAEAPIKKWAIAMIILVISLAYPNVRRYEIKMLV